MDGWFRWSFPFQAYFHLSGANLLLVLGRVMPWRWFTVSGRKMNLTLWNLTIMKSGSCKLGMEPQGQPFIHGWLSIGWLFQSLHRKWLEITKHLFINGCLEFQVGMVVHSESLFSNCSRLLGYFLLEPYHTYHWMSFILWANNHGHLC